MSPSKSVLLVEDDVDIRDAICELLAMEGYKVQSAENGKLGIEKLRANAKNTSVVILDYAMPELDARGFRELQKKSSDEVRNVPVILFSAANLSREEIALIGPAAVVAKPANVDELLRAVQLQVSQPNR